MARKYGYRPYYRMDNGRSFPDEVMFPSKRKAQTHAQETVKQFAPMKLEIVIRVIGCNPDGTETIRDD